AAVRRGGGCWPPAPRCARVACNRGDGSRRNIRLRRDVVIRCRAAPTIINEPMRRTLILVMLVALALGAIPANAGPNREPNGPDGPTELRLFCAAFGQWL